MPGSARTLITNVLPWAAVALLGLMFFIQVGARHKAENRAAKAQDDLQSLRADRVMGFGPQVEPPSPPPAKAEVTRFVSAAAGAERDALRKQLEVRAEERDAARVAQREAVAQAERAEALRATEAARAAALDAQLEADAQAATERVRALEAELAEARAALERRESPVRRWFERALPGSPEDLAAIAAEAGRAKADDVTELRALWQERKPHGESGAIARVLAAMPASPAAAALAGDVLLGEASARVAGRLLETLRAHALAAPAATRVLQDGSNELREDLVSHAAAKLPAWSEEDRTAIRAALLALLKSDDAWTLEIAIGALPKLGVRDYAAALLPFLTHAVPAVRIATVYALLATSDRASAVKTLRATVLALLDEKSVDVRMAGLFLAQELAGEQRSLAFGSSDQAVAKEVVRLKAKLGAMGGN